MDVFKTRNLAEKARQMYDERAFTRLENYKKDKKKSWKVLGFNDAEVEKILALPKIAGNQAKEIMQRKKNIPANLSNIRYTPREIHIIMTTSSHNTMAHMSQIREQEKFRADPRFPIFQMTQRAKRYAAIFKGAPYKPIFDH